MVTTHRSYPLQPLRLDLSYLLSQTIYRLLQNHHQKENTDNCDANNKEDPSISVPQGSRPIQVQHTVEIVQLLLMLDLLPGGSLPLLQEVPLIPVPVISLNTFSAKTCLSLRLIILFLPFFKQLIKNLFHL